MEAFVSEGVLAKTLTEIQHIGKIYSICHTPLRPYSANLDLL